MILLWGVVVGLTMVTLALAVKVRLMQRSVDEITEGFRHRLTADTNVLIDLSSRDRHLRRLAGDVNVQLRLLRRQRNRYLDGDRALREAITNISHDLRTPLTAVSGYLELLEKEPQTDAAKRYLAILTGRVDAMKGLTEELFRYSIAASAEGPLARTPVEINRVLEASLVANYAALRDRSIDPKITMPERPVVRNLDAAALSRVFGNLIANAARHSDGDLSVILTESGCVRFENAASALDKVQVEKLFDRFYTVESARQTTGLGLSIAKSLVEQMGGTIHAEAANGRLRIILRFPNDAE